MGINETMTEFVNLNMVFKTGGSLIEILIYLIGFIKYIIYKIKKKDI